MKKKTIVSFLLLTACILFPGLQATAGVNPKPFVIPELRNWTGSEGTFTPTADSRIVYRANNNELAHIAQTLAADYQLMTGKTLSVATGKAKAGDIELILKKDKKQHKEGYTLSITDRVTITASTPAGLFWGTRTILQLSEQSSVHALPQGKATDYPDYGQRGFMIDCGRKYIPMDYLRNLVKIMAYYKMNTLHIHLNDNSFKSYFDEDWNKTQAAFRLECETFPGLTARDGSYSKKEFIDLQILAEENGVEIVPEIDFPAHSLAFSRYKPEIGSKEYGMDHLDLFNEETYKFMDALLKEYLEGPNPVFRGKRMHIGTDEYSNRDTAVVEKFRYLTDRYIKYVESFGKRACVWGALSHAKGKTPVKSKDVDMWAWYNGYAKPDDMIEQGYKLVSIPDRYVYIVPAAGYYYDFLNTEHLYNKWTPATIGDTTFQEKHPAILGGMFAVWNDHAGNGITVKDIHYRVYPALQTLAAKCWDGANVTLPYAAFNTKRLLLSEAPGVNELGRIGREKALVYEQARIAPNSTTPHTEIGYDYTVEFDLTGASENKGTVLFRSPNATVWLSDPITGTLAFSREDKLYHFRYDVRPGEKAHIRIQGNKQTTQLYVNDKLVDDLTIRRISFNKGKNEMAMVRTLVFPLAETGNFKSAISNLKVYNYFK